jgi:hypothetical protein
MHAGEHAREMLSEKRLPRWPPAVWATHPITGSRSWGRGAVPHGHEIFLDLLGSHSGRYRGCHSFDGSDIVAQPRFPSCASTGSLAPAPGRKRH